MHGCFRTLARMLKRVVALSLLALLAGVACRPSASAPPFAAPAEEAGRPQPKLPTLKLWLGPHELVGELATTGQQQQMGMMWRTNMAEMEAMLFVFGAPHRAGFWMKNTLLPLSCAYIDPEGVILEIRDMKPRDETSLTAATDRVQYVLEVNQGWFTRNKVGVGTVLRTERGSLRESFFGRR